MKVYSQKNKGFTLIELLVVISIISFLSSIVLGSLSSARAKAKDAAIKTQVAQLANLMTLEFNDNKSYCNLQYGWIDGGTPGICGSIFGGTYAAQARQMCTNIYNNAAGGFLGSPTGYKIYSDVWPTTCATTYSFMVYLNNGNWYCSGSSGAKGEYSYYGDPPTSNPGCYGNP